MKKINYLYPHWGSSHLSVSEFFDSVKIQNFQGVEINLPENETFEKEFLRGLEKSREKNPNFICVLQQVLPVKLETVEAYLYYKCVDSARTYVALLSKFHQFTHRKRPLFV